MDTRITPFGDHPDGGKISELKNDEPVPDYMMPISEEARKLIELIPVDQRMSFVLNSDDPRLKPEREWVENKLRNEHGLEFIRSKKGYNKMPKPDLRTREGAMQFLNYHSPSQENVIKHVIVNDNFQSLLIGVWDSIPDGPGKTRFIHALNRARMEANSCIANEGA